jgi:hypothetical protein
MITMSLADGPVVLSNLGVLITTASDILHEIDREKVTPPIWDELMRIQSLLCIAISTCEMTVDAIEAGPDYRIDGREA